MVRNEHADHLLQLQGSRQRRDMQTRESFPDSFPGNDLGNDLPTFSEEVWVRCKAGSVQRKYDTQRIQLDISPKPPHEASAGRSLNSFPGTTSGTTSRFQTCARREPRRKRLLVRNEPADHLLQLQGSRQRRDMQTRESFPDSFPGNDLGTTWGTTCRHLVRRYG